MTPTSPPYGQGNHHKTNCVLPNNKLWMPMEVKLLPKTRPTAFRSGDTQLYSVARVNLTKDIWDTKAAYRQTLNNTQLGPLLGIAGDTISPSRTPAVWSAAMLFPPVFSKMSNLGVAHNICPRVQGFLTNRPKSVRMGLHCSSTLSTLCKVMNCVS